MDISYECIHEVSVEEISSPVRRAGTRRGRCLFLVGQCTVEVLKQLDALPDWVFGTFPRCLLVAGVKGARVRGSCVGTAWSELPNHLSPLTHSPPDPLFSGVVSFTLLVFLSSMHWNLETDWSNGGSRPVRKSLKCPASHLLVMVDKTRRRVCNMMVSHGLT